MRSKSRRCLGMMKNVFHSLPAQQELKRRKVIFAGALPPPVGGQAYANQAVVGALQSRCDLRVCNLSVGTLHRDLKYHLGRTIKVLRAVLLLFANPGGHCRAYLSAESGGGLIYTLLLTMAARLANHTVFLHYHSFTFVDRRSRLMAWIVRGGGRKATHIFLCERMRKEFCNYYSGVVQSLVVSNAHLIKPPAGGTDTPSVPSAPASLRVGLLSHLLPEKGLNEFLELLRAAASRRLPVTGVLAGPPFSNADAATIAAAQIELGERLDYRGPVYGEAKARFYSDIDIFVFPTRYAVEAQPLVLFEAMSHGVPVITFARGCIPCDLKGYNSPPVRNDEPFVEVALARIERWLADPADLMKLREQSVVRLLHLHEASKEGFETMLYAITE
jgi:glycosyltransferase involved in cell wall biosynthesis